MSEEFILGLDEINKAAEKICNLLLQKNIILLKGNLGVGKTTLVKAVCKTLGIVDIAESPSFSIVNEYGNQELFHIDLYRLNNIEEFWDIGGIEYIDGDIPCFIEWPELVLDYIEPSKTFSIEIIHIEEDNKRKYIFSNL